MATLNVKVGLTGLARRIVADGLMDEAQILEAKQAAVKQREPLVAYLVVNKLIDARTLAAAASEEFGAPLVDLDAVDLTHSPIHEVDQKLIRRHRALPLFRRGKRLFVAISDPTNLQALDEIKFQTTSFVDPIVVEEDKLARRLEKALEAIDTAMSALSDSDLDNLEVSTSDEINVTEDITREDIDDAPIVRFVNKVMLDAIRKGASDIHFEPYERFYRVRLRQDGMLREIAQPPTALAPKIAARLKVMARLDISERRVPQDGRIKIRLSQNRAIDFRVNTCPTLYGEKIVLRILDPSSAKLGIDALGYESFQKQLYLDALNRPHGMILVTGPTGSGKTVSLYTGVNILNTGDCNICTAEDPVEIQLPGVNQLNVHPKVGLTFASALRAFLRQDPDVILVGEIRDLETAEIAIKAAQTGHLVLSTLHTNDAPKTLSRLIDIGVAPYAIATAINLIIAQRLARKLCNNCKQPVTIPGEALLNQGFTAAEVEAGVEVYGPVGCDHCTDGYRGRTGIYQVMPVSEETGRIIMAGGNATQLAEQAKREGIWNMRRSGLEKVKNGITSLEELGRVTTE